MPHLKFTAICFKNLTDGVGDTSLTGGIKGVSEETASVVAGQMNAIRINQAEIVDYTKESAYGIESDRRKYFVQFSFCKN